MRKQDQTQLLNDDQLHPSAEFTQSLRAQLVQKENQIMKTSSNSSRSLWRNGLIGATGLAAIAVVGWSVLAPTTQTVSAQKLYDNVSDYYSSAFEQIYEPSKQGGIQATVVTKDEQGPRANFCSFLPNEDVPQYTLRLYSNQAKTEMLYRTERGPKANPAQMIYDTDASSKIIPGLLGNQTDYISQLLKDSDFVDKYGREVSPDTELTLRTNPDNGRPVYNLLLNIDDVCPDQDKVAIAQLMVDAETYELYRTSTYVGSVEARNLAHRRTVTTTFQDKSLAQAKADFIAAGFNLQKARANAAEQTGQTLTIAGLNIDAELGTSWSDLNGELTGGVVFYSSQDRSDLSVSALRSNANPSSTSGLPFYGLKGYTERDGKYFDNFTNQQIVGKITPVTVGGMGGVDAITVKLAGAFEGEAEQMLTIVNTGNSNFPGLVINEDYRQHIEHQADWETFVGSLNF